MYPELLKIPFFQDLTIKSYGTMMVVGFLVALFVMRRLAGKDGLDPIQLTNAALYSLIAGIIGARIFFVVHYHEQFHGQWQNIFALWNGGLEFLGGVILGIAFMLFYLRRKRLPVRRYLDIMAIGLMTALIFGRVGCLLNGCCYGKPTSLPWGIRFPYRSYAYISQINTNTARGRTEPHLYLPKEDYLDFWDTEGRWYPKPWNELTASQRDEVTKGRYRSLPVHPSQVYASINAFIISGLLFLFWKHNRRWRATETVPWYSKSGQCFAWMFILYGVGRFLLELTRDDNPFEWVVFTVSQLLGMAMVALGLALMIIFGLIKEPLQGK
jgi:phosphatidylglycerol:prolipoprotein diacylglycerol transferase